MLKSEMANSAPWIFILTNWQKQYGFLLKSSKGNLPIFMTPPFPSCKKGL